MVIYVLFSEHKDGSTRCWDAITESQRDDLPEYMKEKKSQVRSNSDDISTIAWVPMDIDYRKLLQVLHPKASVKGKIHPIQGEEHADLYRGNRQDGQEHSR